MANDVINQQRQKGVTETPAPRPTRRIVFISHATPEDNPAAAWFATQLTLLGYEVWCDLKNTHGGESEFWLKVQNTIENQAGKFVYILSNTSCDFEKKRGIYKEVQAADNLRINNFIIPVRIEKLTRSLPILFNTSIYINAEDWSTGLHELVERLREDGLPKRIDVDFEKISSWWPAITTEKLIRQAEEEELISNILPIKALPEKVHFIKILADSNPISGFKNLREILPVSPASYAYGDYAVSFAGPFDFSERTHDLEFELTYVVETQHFLSSGHDETNVPSEIAHNIVSYLVGKAWETFMVAKDLSSKHVGETCARFGLLGMDFFRITEQTSTSRAKGKSPFSLSATSNITGKTTNGTLVCWRRLTSVSMVESSSIRRRLSVPSIVQPMANYRRPLTTRKSGGSLIGGINTGGRNCSLCFSG